MKDQGKFVLVTTIISCFADILAITAVIKAWEIGRFFVVIACLIAILAAYVLFTRYSERCNFIGFIEYLFLLSRPKTFNMLPKICLALDKSKEYNHIKIRDMTIKYTCDFRNVNTTGLTPNTLIDYTDVVEYELNVENKDLPQEFVFYSANAYAKGMLKLGQKHGTQPDYKEVPHRQTNGKINEGSMIERHSWQLNSDYIGHNETLPISFRRIYSEKLPANSKNTTILYPVQYAKKIEKIYFKISYISDKTVLKEVCAYKIWRDGKEFKTTSVPEISRDGNNATIEIKPDCSKCEAYYIDIWYQLV